MNVSGSPVKLRGTPTREPVFNLEATWIEVSERKSAELGGYTIVDVSTVLITHLTECLKANLHLLLGRQEVQGLLDSLKESHPVLVTELVPDLVGIGIIQRVLQNLLRESIPVTNLPIILETIGDYASATKHPDDLSELARRRLALYFMARFEVRPNFIRSITLDPRFEQWLVGRIVRKTSEVALVVDRPTAVALIAEVNRLTADLIQRSLEPVLTVCAELRLALRRFVEAACPRLTVLAYEELPAATEIENAGMVMLPAHLAKVEPAPLKAAA
jgi:flagellar biosynthesis protein FlhA